MMYFLLATTVLALMYVVLWVANLGLLLSPIVGLLAVLFWRLVTPDLSGPAAHIRVVGTALAAPAAAAAIALPMNEPPIHLLGILLSAATASAVYSFRAQSHTAVCALCRNPAPPSGGFDCPRCGDRICTRTVCWNARYLRCVRCHEREVVLFPIADTWWTAQLGPRVTKGECLSCYKDATEVDLRECTHCHWPMCRRCWDHYNGFCQRCDWVMPNLPARLAPLVARGGKRDRQKSARAVGREADRGQRGPSGRRTDDRTRPLAPPDGPPRR